MENRIDLWMISCALGIAAYAALALDYVALYDFGFTREAVRKVSLVVAVLIGAMIAIEFLGKKLGKAK